jgi:type VI secretion system secreted protein Hcp
MPTPAYIKIEGETQGLITQGASTSESLGLTKRGHEDEAIIYELNHKIKRPSDSDSGIITGPPIHGPLTIKKEIDKSSPLLYNALTSGERLTKCEISCYRTNENGEDEHYFSIILEAASIIDITSNLPNCKDPNLKQLTHMEEVSFRYRKITWSHEVSGTTGMHDWEEPRE